jgi:hypothetical protein
LDIENAPEETANPKLMKSIDDAAGDDGGDGGAFEDAAIEGGVAGLAGGILHVVSPGMIDGKNREVGGMVCRDCVFAFDAENARGAGGEEFDHAHE